MTKSAFTFLCLAVSLPALRAETTAQTDLASIVVTPLAHKADAKADWQTIYDIPAAMSCLQAHASRPTASGSTRSCATTTPA